MTCQLIHEQISSLNKMCANLLRHLVQQKGQVCLCFISHNSELERLTMQKLWSASSDALLWIRLSFPLGSGGCFLMRGTIRWNPSPPQTQNSSRELFHCALYSPPPFLLLAASQIHTESLMLLVIHNLNRMYIVFWFPHFQILLSWFINPLRFPFFLFLSSFTVIFQFLFDVSWRLTDVTDM